MFLEKLLGRHGSLEDPTVPITGYNLTAAQILEGGGGKSDSGMVVTGKTMLKNSAVWAAVDVISAGVAKLPMSAHRKLPEGGKETASDHAGHRLMHIRPNQLMSPQIFKQTIQAHALTYGTGYAEIQRSTGGTPLALTPLLPDVTTQMAVGDELFVVTRGPGGQHVVSALDCLIIRGPSWQGLVGYALAELAKDTVGMGLALKKYVNKFFANNARPSLLLKHPGQLDEDSAKRIRESFEKMHKGLDNAHRTAVLEEGMEAQLLGTTPEAAQLIDMLNWSIPDVARYFRVPPHKLAWLERATFNNLSESERSFLIDTLDPWLTTWEEECNYKLLTENEKRDGDVFFKFNPGKLLRMDFKDQVETLVAASGGPIMLRNEARDIIDMNPIEEFETPVEPNSNTVPATTEPDTVEPDTVDTNNITPTANQRRLIKSTLIRMVGRLGIAARKVAGGDSNFLNYLEQCFEKQHREKVEAAIGDAVGVIAELRGDDPDTEAKRLTDRLFVLCRSELFAETEKHTASEFGAAIQSLSEEWLSRIPDELSKEFLEGV